MGIDEKTLVRACKEGNERGFAEVIGIYKEKLYRFLYGMTLNGATADELTQETFVRFWKTIASFDENLPIYPWLRRIAHNVAVNEMKKRRPSMLSEETERTLGIDSAVSDNIEKSELKEKIREAIESLDAKKRSVITLRLIEEMSYGDIAKELKCSIGTVMSRLFRAREELRQKIGMIAVKGE